MSLELVYSVNLNVSNFFSLIPNEKIVGIPVSVLFSNRNGFFVCVVRNVVSEQAFFAHALICD